MCELGRTGMFRSKNGRLSEEEENWSISDSSERLRCVRRNDVDGIFDVCVRCPLWICVLEAVDRQRSPQVSTEG